jgi:hypothetical protein
MSNRFFAALLGAVALLFFALLALAADVTGTWSGYIADPGGNNHDISLNLKTDGNKVTGTMTGGPPMGAEQQIVNGKLDGDQLSFEVNAQGPGGESLTPTYKGKVSGNRIAARRSLRWAACRGK